jgi:hypothetical protein
MQTGVLGADAVDVFNAVSCPAVVKFPVSRLAIRFTDITWNCRVGPPTTKPVEGNKAKGGWVDGLLTTPV